MSDSQVAEATPQVEPTKAWRLASSALAEMTIEREASGSYILVVVTNNGQRWETEVTEAVQAAARNESDAEAELRAQIDELATQLQAAITQQQEVLAINQRWQAHCTEQENRIKELEQDNATAREFLSQFVSGAAG